jgi:formate-dependent nitrite reductase membrane component NrfD
MDLFVVDPGWGWWIVLYFYLGGIAAGAYFTATLVDLIGRDTDREISRMGYWIAFPLINLCGLFLTVDLDRPERFWHMLFKSEIVDQALAQGWPWAGRAWRTMLGSLLLKPWSPMSIGAWALLLFGVCSFLSFLGSIWPEGRLAGWLRHGPVARVVQIVGCGVGFFVASYTGALLTATNQPLWSDSTWIAPLFLTSAASTGIATLLLLGHWRRLAAGDALERLERADLWALGLELLVFAALLLSLGSVLGPVLHTGHGILLVAGTLILGLLVPGVLRTRLKQPVAGSICALIGGLILRYALLTTPPELLARAPHGPAAYAGAEAGIPVADSRPRLLPGFSPEDGRQPGSGPGADPGNKTPEFRPRSKVFDEQ